MGHFYYKKIDGPENFVVLGCNSTSGKIQEAWISLRYGANLCRYSYNGQNIIDYELELLRTHDFTGTPVLYPTPNRVEDGVFIFRGRSYYQQKCQRRIFEHGLVYDEAWKLETIIIKKDRAVLVAKIDWNRKRPFFDAFPFDHVIRITYQLMDRSIKVIYSILNYGHNEIPYGFGLHPYFQKLSGDEETRICVPASHMMESTEKLLPTGKLIPIGEVGLDLNKLMPIGDYDLDHVFMRFPKKRSAVIQFPKQGFILQISASDDFEYFVIYSPQGAPYFCLESQTCSTNAHNLYNKGFQHESGLKFVPAGGERSGFVRYSTHLIANPTND